MRRVTLNAGTLSNIADAIRTQSGEQGTMKPGEMAGKIMALEVTGIAIGYSTNAGQGDWQIRKGEASYTYDANNSVEVIVE